MSLPKRAQPSCISFKMGARFEPLLEWKYHLHAGLYLRSLVQGILERKSGQKILYFLSIRYAIFQSEVFFGSSVGPQTLESLLTRQIQGTGGRLPALHQLG